MEIIKYFDICFFLLLICMNDCNGINNELIERYLKLSSLEEYSEEHIKSQIVLDHCIFGRYQRMEDIFLFELLF